MTNLPRTDIPLMRSPHTPNNLPEKKSYGHNSQGVHVTETASPDAPNSSAYEYSVNDPPEDALSNEEEDFAVNPGEDAQPFEPTHAGQVTGQDKTVRPIQDPFLLIKENREETQSEMCKKLQQRKNCKTMGIMFMLTINVETHLIIHQVHYRRMKRETQSN